ncbi:MAG TPA: PH domain-containing protein [Syntrophorhabdaceae bacterium]|nr:PH domain-containing protein [Syntrophorhabdaceae bacterium]
MTQSESLSQQTEPVLYRTSVHRAALLGPAMLLIVGGVSVRARPVAALVMIGLAVLWGVFSIYNLRASEFALTATKLTIRIGFPFKRFYEFPYSKITGVDFHQPALGMMLNFGKVIIVQSNGKAIVFRLVAKPNDFITRLRQQLVSFRQQNDPDAAGAAT